MKRSALSFHAAGPGAWINDPVGLVREGATWVLLVQHRADAPVFKACGWARFASANLLDWSFDGEVIPPRDGVSAYSGSIQAKGAHLRAVYTQHNDANGIEQQVLSTSRDAGRTWDAPIPFMTPAPQRNVRDPFLFRDASGEEMMVLSHPPDWSGWPGEDASRLKVFRRAGGDWQAAFDIGPWSPRGVLWEMPILMRFAEGDLLVVSMTDRRAGGAEVSVRAFLGRMHDAGFERSPHWPKEGRLLDFGFDFYALCPALPDPAANGAQEKRMCVAWLSSWHTARSMLWPGFAGGPISLPRTIGLEADRTTSGPVRLTHRPAPGVIEAFSESIADLPRAGLARAEIDGARSFKLILESSLAQASIWGEPETGELRVSRQAGAPFDGAATHMNTLWPADVRTIAVFVDGPAIEVFVEPESLAISLALPMDENEAPTLCLESDGRRATWTVTRRPKPDGEDTASS